jgi:hypothetical protein
MEGRKTFEELKKAFTTASILKHFDENEPVILEMNASDGAIVAVLSQRDEGGALHSVAYWSRKMHPAELNYDIEDKEMLAIVVSIKHWRYYLEGARHSFMIYINHNN